MSNQNVILTKYLNCLANERYYLDLKTIGYICKNLNMSFEFFDEWACQSITNETDTNLELWNSIPINVNYTIELLKLMARKDDYNEYIRLKSSENYQIISRFFDSIITDYDILIIVQVLYRNWYMFDQYHNIWYQRNFNNTWSKYNGESNILDDITQIIKLIYNYKKQRISKISELKHLENQHNKLLRKLKTQLKNMDFFYDPCTKDRIFEKMDSTNYDIFAFNNKCFDLITKEIRPIFPSDYITITTGYDFDELLEVDDEQQFIIDTLTNTFDSEETRDSVLQYLSTSLCGNSYKKEYHVWVGNGNNGKNTLLKLMQSMLGNYHRSIDTSYILKKEKACQPDRIMVSLKGARFLSLITSKPREIINSTKINKLVNTYSISTRAPCKGCFKMTPNFKVAIISNSDVNTSHKYKATKIIFPNNFVDNPTIPNEKQNDHSLFDKFETKEYKHAMFFILSNLI